MKQAHIHCETVDERVIIVGDPSRVHRVGAMMQQVQPLANNREYISLQGWYKDTPITVISTGMGAPSSMICIEELIPCGAKKIIRVGSAGAYQSHIKLGDLILVEGVVRHDGGSKTYIEEAYPAVSDFFLVKNLLIACDKQDYPYHFGIIRSHDSFYTDQEDAICAYWQTKGILGADLETASLLTLAKLRGIEAAAILNNVVEFKTSLQNSVLEYSENEAVSNEGERRSIEVALEALAMDEDL